MDSWVLGALAVVLIGITLWIVWPGRSSSAPTSTSNDQEAPAPTMTSDSNTALPPQGDRFEDQYTSATADLSAGGVAAATQAPQVEPPQRQSAELRGTPVQEPVHSTRGQPWPEADPHGEAIGMAERSESFPYSSEAFASSPLTRPRTISLGAGIALAILGAIAGAWLYARWQRERNKPVNRLRRAGNAFLSEAADSGWRLLGAAQSRRR